MDEEGGTDEIVRSTFVVSQLVEDLVPNVEIYDWFFKFVALGNIALRAGSQGYIARIA